MEAEADAFADEKGRDAFEFDPIESRYLKAAPASFEIRTPYSRTIVNEIREIPYAYWDADRRLWTVPYRSFDELRRRWPAIEAAAQRSEPEARKARREAIRGTEEDEALKARTIAAGRTPRLHSRLCCLAYAWVAGAVMGFFRRRWLALSL
ncbi:hypothetical protein BN406_05986 (plasmid) [Sinorhizobium meliloti Rm41]|nr:hypothetical protein BN406_05986 [Sinorhizobium meliloti Rm41]